MKWLGNMEYTFKNGELSFDKVVSELDKLVFDFIGVLNRVGVKYVLISGYVAILMGRSRGTEDIDLFIERIEIGKFATLCKALKSAGYWIINCEDGKDAFEMLNDTYAPRFAKEGDFIPNFEVKFPKKETDFLSLEKPLKVTVCGTKLNISTFEVQIPFKVKLGSDKDIEDATHIYQLFKDNINKDEMRKIAAGLGVSKKMVEYGFE
jgi:hypothetical protein